MKRSKKRKFKDNRMKAFANNAAADISDTGDISEGRIPIASDLSVEEARDWVNNGSRL